MGFNKRKLHLGAGFVCLLTVFGVTPLFAQEQKQILEHISEIPEESIVLNRSIQLGESGVAARVSVVKFKVGPTLHDAWCYRTSGMNAKKQPEIFILVLKKGEEPDTAFPKGPIKFLAGIARPPKSEAWNELDFAVYNPFPDKPFAGMIFVPYDGTNIDVAPGSMACVAITKEELETCRAAGSTRVKAAMAHQSKYYPCPVWCDLDRKSTFTKVNVESFKDDPIISKLPKFGSFATALLTDDEFSFRVSPAEAKLLASSLEQYKGMLRIGLTFDPRSTAFMVWTPKESNMHIAVGAQGHDTSKLSGEYLAILGGTKTNSVNVSSDGFVLQLTTEALDKFRAALAAHSELTLPLNEGSSKKFSISWVETNYYNPIDKKTYVAPGGWNTYNPQGKIDKLPAKKNVTEVGVNHLVLLSSDDELKKAITVESLSGYMKIIMEAATKQLKLMHPKTKQEVLIHCELSPGLQAKFAVALNPSEEGIGPKIKELYTVLNATKPIPSKGQISFQIVFDVPAYKGNK